MKRRRAACVGLVMFVCGCERTPTAPQDSVPASRGPAEVLTVSCTPVQSDIQCSATLNNSAGSFDVTKKATWQVTESNLSQHLSPLAIVSAPGLIAPVLTGNIAIRAVAGSTADSPSHTYAVGPGLTAIELAPYLNGVVSDTEGTFVPGALVEIVDGADAGRSDLTRAGNGAFFLHHIPMNVALKIRASKTGYDSVTSDFPGVTNVGGRPGPHSISFRLSKNPGY